MVGAFCLTAWGKESSSHPILRIESGMHIDWTYPVSVDAKEQYAVTGSDDKTIRVWEVKTGTLVKVLRPPIGEGREGQIHAVAISPDGQTIVAGGWTGCPTKAMCNLSMYVFDRPSGRLVRRIAGLPDSVTRVMYSRDGRFLAAATAKGLRVYRTPDYALIAEDNSYDGATVPMDFDRSGRLVVGSRDKVIRLYDKDFRRIVIHSTAEFEPDLGEITDVKFSPDGTKIAVAFDGPRGIIIHEADGLKEIDLGPNSSIRYGVPVNEKGFTWTGRVSALAWSPDGQRLFAARSDFRRLEYNYREERDAHRKGREYYGKVPDPAPIGAQLDIWEWGTFGPKTVKLPVDAIESLYSLSDGRLLFLSGDPAFGILDAAGRVSLLQQPNHADLREAIFFGFMPLFGMTQPAINTPVLVSQDGAAVTFPYAGDDPTKSASFSVHERRFSLEPTGRNDLVEPLFDHRGDPFIRWQFPHARVEIGDLIVPSEQGEEAVGLAFTRDAKTDDVGEILVATAHQLQCYSRKGRVLWGTMTQENTVAINISGDHQIAVAAFATGVIRWYRMRDGQELLALFIDIPTQRWILWTPNGYFDASEGAENLIGWQVNQGSDKAALFFPASHFMEQFYRPEIIQEVLQSKSTDTDVLARVKGKASERVVVSRGFKLPPKATILSPESGVPIEVTEVPVQIQIEDQGGGIDELRLYQNGKLIASETFRGAPGSKKIHRRSLRVSVIPGQNRFRVVALSKDRIEGMADERTIEGRASGATPDGIQVRALPDKPVLHVLVVGLNQYKNPALNLNYALPDARGLQTFFDTATTQLFKSVKRYELYDAAATKVAILAKFQELQTSAPEDVVLIYLAGHGESVGDTWYFVPYEVTTPERDEVLAAKAFSSRELKEQVTKIKAQKVLVLMDSCKSGAALVAFAGRGIDDRRALAQLARATGTFLVAASTSEQVAGEVKELGHGIFTYALLQGLRGGADGGKQKDGVITVRELLAYVENQLPELSAKYKSQPQYPVVDSRGMDFPLAVVR
jgi:hypothetical protein